MSETFQDTGKMDRLLSQQGLLILALIDSGDALHLTYPLETEEDPVVSAVWLTREALYEAIEVEGNDFELTHEVMDQLLKPE